jgi:outer membrane protein with beta-barrel domain
MTVNSRSILVAVLGLLSAAADVRAQVRPPQARPPVVDERPGLSLRPFVMISAQWFDAHKSIEAIFGQPVQPVWGGGLSAAWRNGLFVDFTASRFNRTGERAFFFNDESFQLGIPVKVSLIPVEVTAGARFPASRKVLPYFGGGIGWYSYKEEDETGGSAADVFKERHQGYLALGGAEYRFNRSVGLAVDVQFTHVPGILGTGGISKELSEDDLGGISGRFRLILGR